MSHVAMHPFVQTLGLGGSWGAFLVVGLLIGCGGISSEDLERSDAEYRLGVGLWGERNEAGAFQHLQEAIRFNAENPEAHLALGNLYAFRGNYEQAETHLRAAIRHNLALGTSGRADLTSEARNTLGVVHIHQRRYDQAVATLREATADLLYRTPHLAWGNLGWALLERGNVESRDFEEAELALEQSVRLQPTFCVGWYRLGLLHFRVGREASEDVRDTELREAETALTRAVEVDDLSCRSLQEAWQLRGDVRARLGRREEALQDFERCVEISSETDTGQICSRLAGGQ